jgi:hypothetical protein
VPDVDIVSPSNPTGGSDMTRRSIPLILAALWLATWSGASTVSAGVNPQPFRTGLFGVTTGQSIRISILNGNEAGGIIGPCFRVFDAAGTLLFETTAAPVPGGEGTFVDFTPPPGGAVVRAQLRAEVELLPAVRPRRLVDTPDPVRRRNVHVTLEVFDTASGRTVFTMPFAAVAGVEPQPFAPVAGIEPQPFRTGMFGVVTGQTVRLSILNAGEAGGTINPCFRVFDATGALLVETETGPLAGGVGTFVDFTPPPGGAAVRAQMRAEVELVPAVHPPDPIRRRTVIVSLEVFDTATGATVFTMPYAAIGFNPQPEPPEPIRTP